MTQQTPRPATESAARSPDGRGAPLPRRPRPLEELEQYRPYLTVLAATQVGPQMRDRVDVSGVVQQTFLEAYQTWGRFRGQSAGELAGWLRQILANNLTDALRREGRAKRDAGRQRSLQEELDRSSARLGAFLAVDQSTASQHLQNQERALMLANALTALSEAQREALVLQYWHGWSLAQIGQHMNRTPAAVAGLLKRGLKELRGRLREGEV